jgi:dipeptidyl-peptidase-4
MGACKQLTHTPEAELDPHLSPNARFVTFLRGNDLVLLEIATVEERVVAHSDSPSLSYGAAEFIAEEEMDRHTGHWWAPNSELIAFIGVETHAVPSFRVPDFNDPLGEGQSGPYPKAGDPNAEVRLYVARVGGSSFRLMPLGDDVEYIARVEWAPDANALWVQTQPRSQKRLDLRRVDIAKAATKIVCQETATDWVNLHDDFRLLKEGKELLWASERTGHKHLEVLGEGGARLRTLTSGTWDVVQVVDVDETSGTVTFTGSRDGVTEQHLYRVPLQGGTIDRLSREAGWHEAAFHRRGHGLFVETLSDDRTPPHLRVVDRSGRAGADLPSAATVPTLEDLGPASHLSARDGAYGEPLDIRLVRTEHPKTSKLPLVVYVYGGPGAQQVQRRWAGERGLFEGWLADRGFAVARIDGRGVAARGHASEKIYAGRLGMHESKTRSMACARSPSATPRSTRSGQASGVGLRRLHDAHGPRTQRWHVRGRRRRGNRLSTGATTTRTTPSATWACRRKTPPATTRARSLARVGTLRGHLTLVHGASDDNVHFRESMRLADALIDQGTRFDLMVYPGTHMMETLVERMHLYDLVYRSLAKELF